MPDTNRFSDQELSMEKFLSDVMARRDGELVIQPSPESSINLHDTICAICPDLCLEILSQNSASLPVLNTDSHTPYIAIDLPFGQLKVYSKNSNAIWSDQLQSSMLGVDVSFYDIKLFDYKLINHLNAKYDFIQLFIDNAGELISRTVIALDGGRTVENVLWELAHVYLEADRAYKDITVFREAMRK